MHGSRDRGHSALELASIRETGHCLCFQDPGTACARLCCVWFAAARYNYPNFLNLLTTGMYIPVSFAYVIPAIRAGWIGEDQFAVPKRDFAVSAFHRSPRVLR